MKWSRLLFGMAPITCLLAASLPNSGPQGVVETYTAISSQQKARLRGASMDVDIEASLPKLKKKGRLQALKHISRLGRITYEMVHFEGDKTIKSSVIARYLAAEVEAGANDGSALAITPANYKFKYKGRLDSEGREVYVYQLTPRQKRVGLFKGELWLDAASCLPVRESGRLVKNPSVFLRRVDFVREYDIRDGVAIPKRIESIVDTRLVGVAELRIYFHNVALAGDSPVSITAVSGQ
jgi:hypothetical protein